jgi:hypothetical protein
MLDVRSTLDGTANARCGLENEAPRRSSGQWTAFAARPGGLGALVGTPRRSSRGRPLAVAHCGHPRAERLEGTRLGFSEGRPVGRVELIA